MENTNLIKTLEDLAKLYQAELVRRIQSEDLENTGKLKNSIDYKMTKDGFEISSDAKYAHLLGANGYLKRWRKPSSKEAIDSIAQWARAKGLRPRDKRGRFKSIKDYSYRSLAFAIAKTIDEKGTIKRYNYRGSRILQKVNQKLENRLAGEITEAYKLDLIQGMKQSFKFNNIKIE